MSYLPKATFKLLQVAVVMGALAGCSTEPEARPSIMGTGKMDANNMQCHEMMKNMSPNQMKMMQSCMGQNMGMMGGKDMGAATANPEPLPKKTDSKADAAEHAKHHPAKK